MRSLRRSRNSPCLSSSFPFFSGPQEEQLARESNTLRKDASKLNGVVEAASAVRPPTDAAFHNLLG